MSDTTQQLVATDILFFHDNDERAFIEWIDRMPFVQDSYGEGRSMFLNFSRFPTDDDLWELIGFCRRYGVEMTQLARFLTDENRGWFFDPAMSWHFEIFGVERSVNVPSPPRPVGMLTPIRGPKPLARKRACRAKAAPSRPG